MDGSTVRSSETLGAVFERAPEPVVVLDPETATIVAGNDRAAEVLGYGREELRGTPVGEIHPHDEERVVAFAERVLTGERAAGDRQRLTCRTRPGAVVPVELSGSRLEVDGTAYVLLFVHPEEPSTAARLDRERQRLEQVVSESTHDMLSALTAAAGTLDYVRRSGDVEGLATAERSLERLRELLEELHEGTRTTDGLSTEACSLERVANEAWAQASTGGAALRVEGDVHVSASRRALSRVLVNLFENADEHGDATVVRVGEREDRNGFHVSDDGRGLPDTGDPFGAGVTTDPEGSGLGLAIVERLSEAHGWTVEAGRSVAGGARFEVRVADDG